MKASAGCSNSNLCLHEGYHALEPIVDSSQGYEFYLIITPGFEELALQELSRWDNGLDGEATVSRGGITLNLKSLEAGFELNRVLKIPTRILLRLSKFGCRDFPKLFKKVSSFEWENWVSDETQLTFQASSHASRLFVKKRIEQTCEEARERYLKSREKDPRPPGIEQTILVRLDDDVCTLSIDTSGEILHKRGTRPLASEAPIRETMACPPRTATARSLMGICASGAAPGAVR